MAKAALIKLRENAIESAGILENIFGDRQKIDWLPFKTSLTTLLKPSKSPMTLPLVHSSYTTNAYTC